MYYQSYEEYMRDVLGYPNAYSNNRMPTYDEYPGYLNMQPSSIQNIRNDMEDLYPDIYKLVYPMVQKVCDKNTRGITKEIIDEMVEEVYSNVENDEMNLYGATVNVQVRNNSEIRQNSIHKGKEEQQIETRHRPKQNSLLKDLIKILIIGEIINRPGHRPPCHRPPCYPYPGYRPPMPRYNYQNEIY